MTNSVPIGIRLLPSIPIGDRNVSYRIFILIFTFLCYTSYHLSRKPISVVKSVLHRNCSIGLTDNVIINNVLPNDTSCNWKPFDGSDYSSLFGSLDSAYLFSYAAGMFLSGHIAERMNLRYFLSIGMICSGIMTVGFGMGYFLQIHSLIFYIVIQVIGGLVQSTGWPSVVTCMGNWYGKGKRGLIMGIWNSHTSVGNILGSLIAGAFVNHAWGWSFAVPGIIIGSLGIICFFVLVPNPEDVDCSLPDHEAKSFISKKEADLEKSQKTDSTDESSDIREPLLQSVNRFDGEYGSKASEASLVPHKPTPSENPPISIFRALMVPGVVEFSLCLFFAKLVSYTFLFWLPKYLSATIHIDAEKAADLSTLFDVGGIMGGILAGLVSDYTGARATTCVVMLIVAAPVMYIYNLYGGLSLTYSIVLSLITGALVNGPYALITTAVSADLGTHKSLRGNAKALATVTAIIDGTGSIGSAVGPLLAGVIETHGTWNDVFWMLIASDLAAFVVSVIIALRREWNSYTSIFNIQQLPWFSQILQLPWVTQLPQLKATNLSYILNKTTLMVSGSVTAFVIFFLLGYTYGFENLL